MTEEQRHIYWRPREDPGLEHLSLDLGDTTIKATGLVLDYIETFRRIWPR